MSMRDEFELVASRLGYNLTMAEHETGEYHYPVTQDAWDIWQEAIEAAQAPASGEVEPVAFAAVNGSKSDAVAGLFQTEELAELGAQRIGGDVRPLIFGDTHPPAARQVPEGFVLAERHFTPEYVIEAGKECLRALEKAGCNDTRTIVQAVFQDMLLAIERKLTTTPETVGGGIEPDLMWDAESPEESCRDSAFEFADDRASDMPADETMIVNVMCAKMLPSRQMKIWIDENEDLQWEWITPPQEQ